MLPGTFQRFWCSRGSRIFYDHSVGGTRWVGALALLSAILVVPASGAPVAAANLPQGFVEDVASTGIFTSITGFDFLPDGRLIVADKDGRVAIVNEDTPSAGTVVLNIASVVNKASDRGLLDVAVDPDFVDNGRIFVAYSYDPPETSTPGLFWDGEGSSTRSIANASADGAGQRTSRIVSYVLDPATNFTTVVPNSAVVVMGSASTWNNIGDPFASQSNLTRPWSCTTYGPGQSGNQGTPIVDCLPADSDSHSIGSIRFGTDGYMYVSLGDAAAYGGVDRRALRALDVDELAGKVVRIDANTGAAPPDNPFFDGDPNSNRSKVWVSGLRNPFRFTFDDANGDIYIGDVGWNRYEEINRGTAGASFGWPCFEGGHDAATIAAAAPEGPGVSTAQPGYMSLSECAAFPASTQTSPTRTWCHFGVHPGCQAANTGVAALAGVVYRGGSYPAEYEGLWYGDIIDGTVKIRDLDTGAVTNFATGLVKPVDMQIGPNGDVYYATRITNQIRAIRYTGPINQPPIALVTTDATAGLAPIAVAFDASGSVDPDGTIATYDWNFGDGTTGTGVTATHAYPDDGRFIATLKVTDNLDKTDTASVTITVGNQAPVPVITFPKANSTYAVESNLQFQGSATDAQDGAIPDPQLVWNGVLHHNTHTHEDAYSGTGSLPTPFEFEDHADDTYVELCLTATDSGGLSATRCVDVKPTTVDYTFTTSPPGLDVIYNGEQISTPTTRTLPAGARRTIGVPRSPPGFVFDSWSIGGPPSQTLVTSGVDTTLVAKFVPVMLSPGLIKVVEGEAETITAKLPITLSAPSLDPVTFDFTTIAPTQPWQAEVGTDYIEVTGSATISPGDTTAIISIDIIGDAVAEPSAPFLGQSYNDWILVRLSNITNATLDTVHTFFGVGTVVIVDDDPPDNPGGAGNVMLAPGGANVVEGDVASSTASVPFTLSSPALADVTFDYEIVTFTDEWAATDGIDFVASNGTLTIPAGQRQASVDVGILADQLDEHPLDFFVRNDLEWIFIRVRNLTNATLDTTHTFFGVGTVVIFDNDP
jgi:glucose/arabinose dehydrogenase/chitodextrinase